MSRRSHAFAEGVQKFSWNLERFVDSDGRERCKATCSNFPHISAIAENEQAALSKAKQQVIEAGQKAELGTDPK